MLCVLLYFGIIWPRPNAWIYHVEWFYRDTLDFNLELRRVITVHIFLRGIIRSLQWGHNGRDEVSNHQPHDCLLNRLFRRRSKKTSKLRVTSLFAVNSSVTHEFPAQMASKKNFPLDDVTMCSRLLTRILESIHTQYRGPVNSPHKGQWRGALIFSLICVWINVWINNREAGDLGPLWLHRNENWYKSIINGSPL